MAADYSPECIRVLHLLKERRNVLISGSTGTGKSRLLNEVAEAFVTSQVETAAAPAPVHVRGAAVPIPNIIPQNSTTRLHSVWPAPHRKNRKVYRTTFHQNSKYREFVSGIVPITKDAGGFRVMPGTLYRASEHAKLSDAAALIIIDEINRGPAVQVFGGSIVAIEPDKRLSEDNQARRDTQFFELLDPGSGELVEYALPPHLYILAAMNQADASVEPLDVAFLRRWAPYHMRPDVTVLRAFWGLTDPTGIQLPDQPSEAKHVYEAALKAWEAINKRIQLGRGAEFQIGHGVFLTKQQIPPSDVTGALELIAEVWGYIQYHVEEVFFGDLRGYAAALNVTAGLRHHPYRLTETTYADEPRIDIQGPASVDGGTVYTLLRAIAG
jgi:5-methylcytosine-specific restriction enzyme B